MNTKKRYRGAYIIFFLVLSAAIGAGVGLFYYQYTLACSDALFCSYGGPVMALLTGILAAIICAAALLKIAGKNH
ncbi:hypothetical protein ACQFN5_00425 (plasmid) [Klebsiella sp. WOUb02]|uniref:hypothetical protein n=1 Tax=Klebsiella sp. WOUb02 TaxID=3161071 RepID=UPI003CEAFA47